MKVKDIYQGMNDIAPFQIAEPWDNVGLLVGDMEDTVKNVLLALDITVPVIEEALRTQSNVIITHHPIIFSPLKNISSSGIIAQLLRNKIHVISAHTNLDMAQNGVNTALSQALELEGLRPLQAVSKKKHFKIIVFVPISHTETLYSAMVQAGAGTLGNYTGAAFVSRGEGRFLPEELSNPTIGVIGRLEKVAEEKLELIVPEKYLSAVIKAVVDTHPYEDPAYDIFETYAIQSAYSFGCVGRLSSPMSGEDFANHVKTKLKASNVRYTNPLNTVSTVGLCSGSGGDFLQLALDKKVDAFVTGEVKHHQILEANAAGITLVDAGHFATENIFMNLLKEELGQILPEITVHCSASCTDGIFAL